MLVFLVVRQSVYNLFIMSGMIDSSQKKLLWEHPTQLVYEKKHDSALRKTLVNQLRKKILLDNGHRDPEYTWDEKIIFQHLDKSEVSRCLTDSNCYAIILDQILADSAAGCLYGNRRSPDVKRMYTLAKDNIRFQHNYCTSNIRMHNGRTSRLHLKKKLNDMTPTIEITNLIVIANEFKNVVDKLGTVRGRLSPKKSDEQKLEYLKKHTKSTVPTLKMDMSWSRNLFVITPRGSKKYLLPASYLLMIHNKLCDLISVLTLVQYQNSVCYDDNAYNSVVELVKEMGTLSIRYSNDFANVAGALEGIIVAEILLDTEEWMNEDLLINIEHDLSVMGYNYRTSHLRAIVKSTDIPLRYDLGCLSKIVGHPFVSMEEGAKKLHKRTTCQKNLSYAAIIWVTNKAKETFVKNYLYRNKRWPPVILEYHNPGKDALEYAMLRNLAPDHPDVVERCGRVCNDDWSRLTLNKVEEFRQLENIIPFLKDKSISVLRHDAVTQFIEHNYKRNSWQDTRLLLYYLMNPLKKLDHKSFVDRFTECGDLDLLKDWLIIRLVPKEKEEKIAFRGFGVKTYFDRMRTLTQEKNVAHFLSLYCDEQAMTMGELEISKRLYSIRSLHKAYTGHRILNINFDSSGWNNCFRDETVKPVMRETLSRLYGTDVLDRIHEAYEKGLYIIPDGESTYHWDGQQGGIDGLNQYAWVWVYINQIKYAMKDFDCMYHMFCKGDDMRIAVVITPKMLEYLPMKEWHKNIVQKVSDTAKEFGHEIKISESYGSEHFFTFSKAASIKSIELPQSFRKIQKAYGANNAIMTTLDEYVASTFSNAHSACRVSTNTYACYWVALLWSYYYILMDKNYDELSDDELVCLLLIPNILGGLPTIYLHNMYVRAESDLLSPFIDMVKYSEIHHMSYYRVLTRFLVVTRRPGNTDMVGLFQDPYSLNIVFPRQPLSILRRSMKPALKRIARNEDIKELFAASNHSSTKRLIQVLSTAKPLDAKIMASIYSCTPDGVLSELVRKFETSRSIMELLLLRRSSAQVDRIFANVLRADNRLQEWRVNKVQGNGFDHMDLFSSNKSKCATEIAQLYRNTTWKADVTGVSMPPLVHQVYYDTPSNCAGDHHAGMNHFLYNYEVPTTSISPTSGPHWSCANMVPFLGYTTRTGNIAPSVSFVDHDPVTTKLKAMLDIYTWILKSADDEEGNEITSNLHEVLDIMIGIYTSISREELSPFSAIRRSGTSAHHCRAPNFRESIIPNQLSNIYQNVSGNSNSHVTLRTSDQHYTVNFLHILCNAIHSIHIELEVSNTITSPREVWGVTTDCAYCTRPIIEKPIIVESHLLRGLKCEALASCRVDKISKGIILRSFNDFQKDDFRLVSQDGNLTLDDAQVAICREFVRQHTSVHRQLEDRFSHHALTSEAKNILTNMAMPTTSRIIGFTELKRVSIGKFVEALIPVVYDYVMHTMSHFGKIHLLASLQEIPSGELPWTGLLRHIQEIGKLGILLKHICNQTNQNAGPIYEDAYACAPVVGAAVMNLVMIQNKTIHTCVFSYKSMQDTVMTFTSVYNPLRCMFLAQVCIKDYKDWKRTASLSADVLYMIAMMAIYVCAMDMQINEAVEDMKTHMLFHSSIDINLFQYAYVSPETIENLVDDEACESHKLYAWCKSQMPRVDWPATEASILGMEDVDDTTLDYIKDRMKDYSMRVTVTDIASAISVIRKLGHIDDAQYTLEDDNMAPRNIGVNMRPIEFRRLGRFTPTNGVIAFPRVIGQREFDKRVPEQYEFTTSKIILDECHSCRIFGSSTTAVSKLAHVMKVCNIPNITPKGSVFMCLADGYGGFAGYLSAFASESILIFNTIPHRIGAGCYPFDALSAIQANNITLNIQAIIHGQFDLTTEACIQELAASSDVVDIMTCDADIKRDNADGHYKILIHVVQLFLHRASRYAALIIRCNLQYAADIVIAVRYLYDHCDRVMMVRCPHSNVGGEVYLVAHGVHLKEDQLFLNIEAKWYLEHRVSLNKFSYNIKNAFDHQVANHPDVNLVPHTESVIRDNISYIPLIIDSKVPHLLGIPGSFLNQVGRNAASHRARTPTEAIRHYLLHAERQLRDKRDQRKRHISVVRQSRTNYDLKTATHDLHNDMRILQLEGFVRMCSYACASHKTISKQFLRESYARSVASLSRPNLVFPVKAEHYSTTFCIHDRRDFAPYAKFIKGVRLAQHVIGTSYAFLDVNPSTGRAYLQEDRYSSSGSGSDD